MTNQGATCFTTRRTVLSSSLKKKRSVCGRKTPARANSKARSPSWGSSPTYHPMKSSTANVVFSMQNVRTRSAWRSASFPPTCAISDARIATSKVTMASKARWTIALWMRSCRSSSSSTSRMRSSVWKFNGTAAIRHSLSMRWLRSPKSSLHGPMNMVSVTMR